MICASCGKEGFSLCPECDEEIMKRGCSWPTAHVKPGVLTGPCFNERCPCHDQSESGCRSHSLYAVDLCNSYMTYRGAALAGEKRSHEVKQEEVSMTLRKINAEAILRLQRKAPERKDLVDIANFAMMLWRRT